MKQELEKKLAETQALLKKMDEQKLAESNLKTQQEALRELEQSLEGPRGRAEKEGGEPEGPQNPRRAETSREHRVHGENERRRSGRGWRKRSPTMRRSQAIDLYDARDKEAYSVMMTMKLKDNPKATYEKAVAKLKTGASPRIQARAEVRRGIGDDDHQDHRLQGDRRGPGRKSRSWSKSSRWN